MKSLMVIVASVCDEPEAAGALALPLAPPPHPASAATVKAIRVKLKIWRFMCVDSDLCA